jgi:hypothetical protein
MVTRDEIEAEAAAIRHLIDSANPTGGKHTPTPWKAAPAVAAPSTPGEFAIVQTGGHVDWQIATFQREADRDLALYFVNAHAGMLAVMRSHAEAFDFIAKGTADAGLRDYAGHMAELARIYRNGFASMGEAFVKGEAPDAEVLVHVLNYGQPLCGFSVKIPADWPPGNKWVGLDEWADATCPRCIEALKKRSS